MQTVNLSFVREVIMSLQNAGFFGSALNWYMKSSLILLICIGMVLGVFLGVVAPSYAGSFSLLGDLFVGALKAIAPVLVFTLVCASVTNHEKGTETKIKPLIVLYLVSTFAAALIAVIASFIFPTTLQLQAAEAGEAVQTVSQVLKNLVVQVVTNPITALSQANYISLIFWAVAFGFGFQHCSDTTKKFIIDLGHTVSDVVRMIVRCAPFGIFGLVYTVVGEFGIDVLVGYVRVLAVLLGSMFFVAFIVNPIIVYAKLRQNPYPLIWFCIKNSGVTAFFTRSSAANIPVNMDLCRRLRLPESTYSISIPLGATINMAGAAITITVLTLAAATTLGIQVNLFDALLLSVVASLCACGASGIAGGSLMLIPLACSLFGISNDIAFQVVGVGFIIGVLQDSTETALNSSTDVVLTATAVLTPLDDVTARVHAAVEN